MNRERRIKGISEIVSVILLVLIVASFGSMIILRLSNLRQIGGHMLESQLDLARMIQEQPNFNAIYTVFNKTEDALYVVINVGPGYMEVRSIYLNDTLFNIPGSTVLLNGNPIDDPQHIVLVDNDMNVVKIIGGPSINLNEGDRIIVKIVSATGLQNIVAGRVVE